MRSALSRTHGPASALAFLGQFDDSLCDDVFHNRPIAVAKRLARFFERGTYRLSVIGSEYRVSNTGKGRTHRAPLAFRRERYRSLSHRCLRRAIAGGDTNLHLLKRASRLPRVAVAARIVTPREIGLYVNGRRKVSPRIHFTANVRDHVGARGF
jgi:hypothetical protein